MFHLILLIIILLIILYIIWAVMPIDAVGKRLTTAVVLLAVLAWCCWRYGWV